MGRPFCFTVALLAFAASTASGQVEYQSQIKPILAEHCFSCHSALRQKGELRLDAISLIRRGGSSGSALVAGQPDNSLIVDALRARDGVTKMPPDGSAAVKASDIALIEQWIREGARAENEPIPDDPREHWAYRPPHKIDGVKERNPIDHYFGRLHATEGLNRQPAASRDILLRRAYLDLIGLPPTIEQLEVFAKDESPMAYRQAIDRLLDDPHHGERWGRHWMDVWRYTDWFGLGKEVRYSQKHIWRWRDWIVESLNEDKGYDRMVVEMLAADEIAGDDPQTLRATGYLARNWYLFNRNYWLDDVVEHTAKGFLGITINCARCHEHKYDPISQREYYQLRAFFEPHQVRLDPIGGELDLDQDGLPRVFDEQLDRPTYVFVRGQENSPDKSQKLAAEPPVVLPPLPNKIAPVDLPVLAYYPMLRPDNVKSQQAKLAAAVESRQKRLQATQERIRQATDKLASLEKSEANAQTKSESALIFDQFGKQQTKLWRRTGGEFDYRGQFVVHKNPAGPQQRLEALAQPPRDFVATLKLKVIGGATRSVGMAFDMVGGDRIGVYLSPGSRFVSMYQIIGGKETYPARKNLPVENDVVYTLTFAVRGPLLNVWLDDQFAFAHRLRQPRRGGGFAITNYQSIAEYHEFSLHALDSSSALAENTAAGATTRPPTFKVTRESLQAIARNAERQLKVDELALRASELRRASHRTRALAESVKFGLTDGAVDQSATAAAAVEREAKVAAEELAVEQGRVELAQTETGGDQKKIDEAKGRLVAAEKKRDQVIEANRNGGSKYSPLGKMHPNRSSGRRLALAKWITARQHPLTARVLVNHVWVRHFGDSLVDSVFDFGLRTKAPRHQALLDHLAVDLMEHGWSMKRLHRMICTSQLYQMDSSSAVSGAANRTRDPDNKNYWRMNTRRMEHEIIRDSLLHVAGRLDNTIGGAPLATSLAETAQGVRRSIYYRHARDDKIRMSRQFDDASVEECYRRRATIVPQQALVLANSEFVGIQVAAAASRLTKKSNSRASYIRSSFAAVLGRPPSPQEVDLCSQALEKLTESQVTDGTDRAQATAKAREHLVHVLFMHNDFITIR
ncbi:MAG: DUF1553 domain-containing protein [Pirellulaceae bacterium]|jgi:mono/diheme cytochrome c family protein|nr:DUF1553 domain-containing protein [Pirellulaceae bacterium]